MRSVWRGRGSDPVWIKNGGTFSEIPLACKGDGQKRRKVSSDVPATISRAKRPVHRRKAVMLTMHGQGTISGVSD